MVYLLLSSEPQRRNTALIFGVASATAAMSVLLPYPSFQPGNAVHADAGGMLIKTGTVCFMGESNMTTTQLNYLLACYSMVFSGFGLYFFAKVMSVLKEIQALIGELHEER